MADDRIERLAWLIQGNTSEPLLTMELALKAVAVAKELGSDDDAPGRFAAYMLEILAGCDGPPILWADDLGISDRSLKICTRCIGLEETARAECLRGWSERGWVGCQRAVGQLVTRTA